MLSTLNKLAKPASLAILRAERDTKVPGKVKDRNPRPTKDSPLYAAMQDLETSDEERAKGSDRKAWNARSKFQELVLGWASMLGRATPAKLEYAKKCFQKLNVIIPATFKQAGFSTFISEIRKAVPTAYLASCKENLHEEYSAIKGRKDAEVKKQTKNQHNLIEIDPKQVYDIQIKTLNSNEPHDWVVAAMLAAGCRYIEILNPEFKFAEAPDSKREIIQHGVAKGKLGASETMLDMKVRKPIVGNPTHMNPKTFLALIKSIRMSFNIKGKDGKQLENKKITSRHNGQTNKYLKKAFEGFNSGDIKHTSHLCRKLYTVLAFDEFGQFIKNETGGTVSPSAYASDILGHQNSETQRAYTRFKVKNSGGTTSPESAATVARLESKVEALQNTVSAIQENDTATQDAHLLRKDPKRRDGDAAKFARLGRRIAELRAAGKTIDSTVLKSIGYGSDTVNAYVKLSAAKRAELEV